MRFLRPELAQWWLVLPLLVAGWTLHWQVTRAFRRRTPVARRFAALSHRATWRRDAAVLAASLTTGAALVFSLMRPQILLAHRVADYERQDLIVLLDRSVSMRAHDIRPSRFSRATLELRNFLRHKPEAIDRIGLVGFADASVVLSHLTGDLDSLFFYLDWIDNDPTPLFGTNIGAALDSALDVARKDDQPTRKLFLLLSDGEDYGAELRRALDAFRTGGHRVDCIGIGSEDAVPIPLSTPDGRDTWLRDDAGRAVTTTFEEATLLRIATTTGGRYVRSTSGRELAQVIADLVRGERKLLGWRTSTEYRDLYPAGLTVAVVAGAILCLLL